MANTVVQNNKGQKVTYVIRRSIFVIFMFFSVLVMLVCFFFITIGLFYRRLTAIIEDGARIPEMLNIAIMAETGSTITQDAVAMAQIDLIIVKGFTERTLETYHAEGSFTAISVRDEIKSRNRKLQDSGIEEEASNVDETSTVQEGGEAGLEAVTENSATGKEESVKEPDQGVEEENQQDVETTGTEDDGTNTIMDATMTDGSVDEVESTVEVVNSDETVNTEQDGSSDTGDIEESELSPQDDEHHSEELAEETQDETPVTIDGNPVEEGASDEENGTKTDGIDIPTTEDSTVTVEVDTDQDQDQDQEALSQDEEELDPEGTPLDSFVVELDEDSGIENDRFFQYRNAVPQFLMDEGEELRQDQSAFYARPWVDSMDEMETVWPRQIKQDFRLCSDLNLFMDKLLSFPQTNFPAILSFFGTQNDSWCNHPPNYRVAQEKDHKNDIFKCELDQSGYYNPVCRQWYTEQEKHKEKEVISNLYNDAATGQLIGSLCSSIMIPHTDQFYGALCIDIDMIQGYFKTENPNRLGPNIYDTPAILQIDNKLSLDHLGKSILHSEIKNWQIQDQKVAKIYGGVDIFEGSLEISSETNTANYSELEDSLGYIFTEHSSMQKVFFIFSSTVSSGKQNLFVESPFQFCVFTRSQSIESLILMTEHLYDTVALFWTPYFIFASIAYLLICGVVVDYLVKSMTEPFLELTKRIHLNVYNIQKQKRKAERDKRDGLPHSKSSTIELQVDLLRGFKSRNKEMNELFMNFNSMAKILFVGHASAQTDFSYQQFFDLTAAADLLKGQRNLKGTSTIYMILGIKLAMKSDENYLQALRYMDHSEKLQEEIINESEAVAASSELLKARSSLIEDKYILAFRQYTRAIISYNSFVEMDIDSYTKFPAHDKRRIEYRKQFDYIGFDALNYFQKSLDSWPSLNNKDHDDSSYHMQEDSYNLQKNVVNKDSVEEVKVADLETGKGDAFFGVEASQENEEISKPDLDKFARQTLVRRLSTTVRNIRRQNCPLNLEHQQSMKEVFKVLAEEALHASQIDFSSSSSESSVVTEDFDMQSEIAHDQLLHNVSEHSQESSHRDGDNKIREGDNKNREREESLQNCEDYIIYIRLKIMEVRILLLPSLGDLIKQLYNPEKATTQGGQEPEQEEQEEQSVSEQSILSKSLRDQSNASLLSCDNPNETSALINNMDNSSFFLSNPHLLQVSEQPSSSSIDGLELLKDKKEESGEDFLSSVCLFKPRAEIVVEQQVRIFFQTFRTMTKVNPDFHDAVTMINDELDEIGADIFLYHHKHGDVKPMGLSRIRKTALEQNYFYLLGLYKFTQNAKIGSLKGAINNLVKSVKIGNQQVNAQAKKSLMLMNHILHMIDQKQEVKISSMDLKIEQIQSKIAIKLRQRLQQQMQKKKPASPKRQKEIIPPCFTTLNNIMPTEQDMMERAAASSQIQVVLKKQSQSPQPKIKRRITIAELKQDPDSHKLHQKLAKKQALQKEVENLKKNIMWTEFNLSRHVVTQRSIYFVIDSVFEHYKQHQMCMELVSQTFFALAEDDYFGLSIHQGNRDTIDSHELLLEEKKNNVFVKRQILEHLRSDEQIKYNRQWNNYLKHDLVKALNQSAQLPTKTIRYQNIEFESPIKWVVALVGDLKGLTSLKDLPSSGGTNLLVVYVTDEQPDQDTFRAIQKGIRESFPKGGLMIVRYREIFDSFVKKQDTIKIALAQVKSAIALYPSRNIPIIQEQFHL